MTNWQTYRNGNPRQPWDLERLARHRATKLGYRVHRSRRRKGPDNAGNLMLIHKASSTVLLGTGYTATVEMILKFMERERIQYPVQHYLSDPDGTHASHSSLAGGTGDRGHDR